MIELIITLLLITLTILIAIVPLWYPTYSIFTRNANTGLKQLLELEHTRRITSEEYTLGPERDEATQDFGVLKKGDKGFDEIHKSIASHTSVDINPVRYELVHHCPEEQSSLIGEGGSVRKLE